MKLEYYVDDNDKIKLCIIDKKSKYLHDSYIRNKIDISENDWEKIISDCKAVTVKNRSTRSIFSSNFKYHFLNEKDAEAAITILQPLLDTRQNYLAQLRKIERDEQKARPINVFIAEIIDSGDRKFKITTSLKEINRSVIYNGYRIENTYYIGKLSQTYAKEICKEFNKYKFDDFIDAILRVREIAEPYLMMEKITL
jgi:hypothetical protein